MFQTTHQSFVFELVNRSSSYQFLLISVIYPSYAGWLQFLRQHFAVVYSCLFHYLPRFQQSKHIFLVMQDFATIHSIFSQPSHAQPSAAATVRVCPGRKTMGSYGELRNHILNGVTTGKPPPNFMAYHGSLHFFIIFHHFPSISITLN